MDPGCIFEKRVMMHIIIALLGIAAPAVYRRSVSETPLLFHSVAFSLHGLTTRPRGRVGACGGGEQRWIS